MTDAATTERLYRESKQAICTLVTPENEHTPVPACPGWTLHDIVAHLTGALEDLIVGNIESGPTPAWTAAQVQRYRETDLIDLCVLWEHTIDRAGPLFRHMGLNFLPDVVTHEFDVRGALGNQDRRDAEALLPVFQTLQYWNSGYFEKHELPAIEVVADGHAILIGDGDPQITLTTTLYEASRVFTGRRSLHQVRQLDWSGDPEPWLEHLTVLGQAEQDVIE